MRKRKRYVEEMKEEQRGGEGGGREEKRGAKRAEWRRGVELSGEKVGKDRGEDE